MSNSLRFRVRGPNGTQQMLDPIDSSSTLKDLQLQIINKLQLTNTKPECIQIKFVFPPPRVISDTYSNTILSSLKLTSGNLIVNIGDPPILAQQPQSNNNNNNNNNNQIKEEKKDNNNTNNTNNNNNNNDIDDNDGTMIIKQIASDNSCLFNAVGYLCENGNIDLNSKSKSTELREVIASIVMSDPIKYNKALLGKTNDKYIEYIMKSNTWGGYIELSILSVYYELQINAIDIVTLNVHRFGEGNNYKKCVYVIYDGIHYDSLIMKLNNNTFKYIFNTKNDEIFAQSLSIASDLNSKKKFTDVYNFGLLCSQCNAALKGQTEAQKHAELTGHTQFTQYK